MDDNKQIIDRASADGDVMERVLNAFDGPYDNPKLYFKRRRKCRRDRQRSRRKCR